MFNLSVRKYPKLALLAVTLFASNAWAGCDIDRATDKNINSSTATLKVTYDTGSGPCQELQWHFATFAFRDAQSNTDLVSSVDVDLRDENNRRLEVDVPRDKHIKIVMFLRKGGSIKFQDSYVEWVN